MVLLKTRILLVMAGYETIFLLIIEIYSLSGLSVLWFRNIKHLVPTTACSMISWWMALELNFFCEVLM